MTRPGGYVDGAKPLYVEVDPSGRYGRFRDVLGKGAMKTVYKAFDEVLGMEVAWNQVKLNDVFCSPEELQRLYSEVHLLKSLNHESIIRFYKSWIDVDRRAFNIITEMFTSGSLRDYKKKYHHVDIRAVKNWARQVLRGLAYLHGHDPPVIHRDLKCDNIFVNGHLGQVKIGDLGLATILRGSQTAHSVIGTPEFMAPELYEEEYNELVDVYSFGMCVLEMLTSEYPYSECCNPAQIYKKVTSGKLPEAFYKIKDVNAQRLVGKCLENVSKRLPAKDLFLDPFLASDEVDPPPPIMKIPSPNFPFDGIESELVPSLVADPTRTTDMSITGSMDPENDTIFLKVQISDKDGRPRNIHFPFDIMNDTPVDVALEMVKELEIDDWEPLEIADMIEEEISSLVPSYKESGASQFYPQHSFNYAEDDDDNGDPIRHPFYSTSCSSSQTSFPAFASCYATQLYLKNSNACPQEDLFSSDDVSSDSSLNSYRYSCISYDDGNYSSHRVEATCAVKTMKCSRFCPAQSASCDSTNDRSPQENLEQVSDGKHEDCSVQEAAEMAMQPTLKTKDGRRKMSRIQSLVDIRSHLLHRSLVEMSKRRLFKTVGAVENIGFQGQGERKAKGPKDHEEKWRFRWRKSH